MPMPTASAADPDTQAARARICAIMDRAAEQSGVTPEVFRDGIREAVCRARRDVGGTFPVQQLAPEDVVLALLFQLF